MALRISGFDAGRNQQRDGVWHNLDADGQLAKILAVGFGKDARRGAGKRAALHRERI